MIPSVDQSEDISMTWNVYGKLRMVTGVSEGTIQYSYDVQGNRLKKARVGGEFPTDVYVRDASGNIIAIYEKEFQFSGAIIDRIREFDLYGSNRLGALKQYRVIHNTMGDPDPLTTSSYRNFKSFELSNHLCNVLNAVSDMKLGQDDIDDGIADYYLTQILSASDYYPFGLEMPGRTMSSETHRFGFNGKEKDPSISSLTHYDYGFRIFNPAIGRFLSVDPLTASYPGWSPYPFAMNRPIDGVDLDGLEWVNINTGETKEDPHSANLDKEGFVRTPGNEAYGDALIIPKESGMKMGSYGGIIGQLNADKSAGAAFSDMGQMFVYRAAEIGVAITTGATLPEILFEYVTGMPSINPRTWFKNPSKSIGIVDEVTGGSNFILSTSRKLQAKFKHAADFGIVGSYSTANASKFSTAINQHINSSAVKVVNGTYRGQSVIHYVNPHTGLNVISSTSGEFIGGWKLNPIQLENVLKYGGL